MTICATIAVKHWREKDYYVFFMKSERLQNSNLLHQDGEGVV